MEIINVKRVWTIVTIICVATAICTYLIIQYYSESFSGTLSNSQADWGTFGDYIGGVLGTIFNLVAVIFSFLGIYITLKIATRIHENEQKFQSENLKREIELLRKQNKPYAYINVSRFSDKVSISFCNYGLGPLIVKNWKLKMNDVEYKHFSAILDEKLSLKIDKTFTVFTNTAATHILAPNTEKILFSVEAKGELSEQFIKVKNDCRNFLGDTSINVIYEDIFENKYSFNFSFDFFK